MASFHAIGRALTFGAIGPAKVDPNKPISPFAQAMNAQNGKIPAPTVSAPAPTNAGSLAAPTPPDAGLLGSTAAKTAAQAAKTLRRKLTPAATPQFGGSLATSAGKPRTLSGY